MLFHSNLPKNADIFVQSKYTKYFKKYYKPYKILKNYGIIITGIVVFFGAITIFTSGQHINKMLAFQLVRQADTINTSTNNSMAADDTSDGSSSASISPIPSIAIPTQLPNIEPSTSPSLPPIPQPNGQNITDTSSQIISLQQQVANQMQTCISNNIQMINQITSLQNQQQQLQNQINALVSQIQSIDATTPTGSAKQQALDQQRQQVQQQSDAIGTAINVAQDAKNTRNNQCEANVSSLEQQRDTLENNLDNTFNSAMNIQLPQ